MMPSALHELHARVPVHSLMLPCAGSCVWHVPLSAHGYPGRAYACVRTQPKPIVSGTAAGEAPQIGISSLATVELRSQIGDLMYSESAVLSDVLMFDAPTGKEFR